MTERNEKLSNHESSTDTIIGELEIIANVLEGDDFAVDLDCDLFAISLREAAQRLDKLENELSALMGND